METIIQQYAIKLVTALMKLIEGNGLANIDNTCSEVLKLNNESALELIKDLISSVDASFFANKQLRKELNLVVQERNRERDYLTELGWLHYSRSYYKDEVKGIYSYPLDNLMCIDGYERIGKNVCASLVEKSASISMRASSEEVTDGELSAQSVCNKVHLVGKLEIDIPEIRRDVSELHIFADEDHVSLQSGKSKMVPLVSVCEGIKKVCKGRNATINPVHFTSDIFKTDTLWNKVSAYISGAYNVENIANVYIHGDGAAWIKKGVNEIGGSVFILDGFHLQRRLKPFIEGSSAECINELLSKDRKDDFKTVAKALIKDSIDIKKRKRLEDNLKYILNQWDGVVERYKDGRVGSCTEAMVSHVLSERLSRDPMGWSEDGLTAMAGLRVYVKNGGKVRREHFSRSDEEKQTSKLEKYAENLISSFLDFKIDNSIFEKKIPKYGKVTPMSVVLKSMGSVKGIRGYNIN